MSGLSSDVGAFPGRLNWDAELEGVPRGVPAERSREGCAVREPLSGCRESKPREDSTERGPHYVYNKYLKGVCQEDGAETLWY